jgi:hypothetical protein
MWSGGLWWKDSWYANLTATDGPLHPQLAEAVGDQFSSFRAYAFERDTNLGRFRPLYWALLTVESALLREHPLLWVAETHVIGIAACVLLQLTARRLGLGRVAALFVPLWTMIAGRRLWTELQLSEEPALLLTALALYGFLRGACARSRVWDGVGLAGSIGAGLLKESFAAILPALLLYRVWLEWRQSEAPTLSSILRRRIWLISSASAAFLGLSIVIALLLLEPGGYDNRILAGASTAPRWLPVRWIQGIWGWSESFAYFAPLIGLAWLASQWRAGERARRDVLGAALVVAAWLLPQFLIYGRTGFREHYAFPAILPVAFVCALGIDLALRRAPRWIAVGIAILSTASLLTTSVEAANVAARIAAASEAQARWMQRVAASAAGSQRILLATQRVNNSRNMTFLTMLGELGVRVPVSLFVGDSRPETDNPHARRAASTCFPGSEPLDGTPRELATVGVIACMMPAEQLQRIASEWYEPADWSALEIERSYASRKLTFFPPRLRTKTLAIRYAVLTRTP